jgi:hypothetical protein
MIASSEQLSLHRIITFPIDLPNMSSYLDNLEHESAHLMLARKERATGAWNAAMESTDALAALQVFREDL